MGKRILVIGSLNIDLVSDVKELPKPGETITSSNFHVTPGGKGANQAVTASKLEGDVTMFGMVGQDEYGEQLLKNLSDNGVNIDYIKQGNTTGRAFITVDEKGENHIVLVPGANHEIEKTDIDDLIPVIKQVDIVVFQLEIPIDIVEYAIKVVKKYNKTIIVNPAPAVHLSNESLRYIDILIPNESELQLISNMPTTTSQEISDAARKMIQLGVKMVIVTMGREGSYLINEKESIYIPAHKVNAVDTTAAGDSYIGAFSVAVSQGMTNFEAATYASKVAAITVTRTGAQESLPSMNEVNIFNK